MPVRYFHTDLRRHSAHWFSKIPGARASGYVWDRGPSPGTFGGSVAEAHRDHQCKDDWKAGKVDFAEELLLAGQQVRLGTGS